MKGCTLEDATLELGKPTEVADFQVQYNPPGERSHLIDIRRSLVYKYISA